MKRLIIERINAEELKAIITEAIEQITKKERNEDEFLTVEQASAYLHIPVSTLYDYTSAKKIPHYKKGKKLHFIKQELSDWMKQEPIKE